MRCGQDLCNRGYRAKFLRIDLQTGRIMLCTRLADSCRQFIPRASAGFDGILCRQFIPPWFIRLDYESSYNRILAE